MVDGDVLVLFWNTFAMCSNAPFATADEIEPEDMKRSVPPFASIVCDMYESVVVGTAILMITRRGL